jgi:hypothetical protein
MALAAPPWQESAMTTPDPVPQPETPPAGGGCLIAAGLILGPIVGLLLGETSAGLLVGGAVGVVAAIVLALVQRR